MPANVRSQSAAVEKMAQNWNLLDALMAGTHAMRAAGKTYLPQWPMEENASYAARLGTATLFPAYERTVSVMTGKPFSKPLTYGNDIPSRIKPWLENIDLQNRNLHAFAADLAQEALASGLCGILVDVPQAEGARTAADEQKLGIRPYFVHVHHDAILGWKTARVNGSQVLTQLRLLENIEVEDGEFATKTIEQVRVLEPGKWSTYRKNAKDEWVIDKEGSVTLPVIPFIPVYGLRKDFMIGTPPMMELAHANVEHWQSKSDQQTILHVARVPILFGKELGNDTPISVGSGALISASSEKADLKYVEHTGAAIEAGRTSLLDLEDRMRQTGAELLVIKPGKISQVQVMAENEQQMCDLQRIVQGMEDSLDQALDLMAQWIGEKDGGHVQIYSDFGAATLAEASAQLLLEAKGDGTISHKTLLNEFVRRGIMSPDLDIDAEIIAATAELAARTPQRKENINI
jgi:hypothetical protein